MKFAVVLIIVIADCLYAESRSDLSIAKENEKLQFIRGGETSELLTDPNEESDYKRQRFRRIRRDANSSSEAEEGESPPSSDECNEHVVNSKTDSDFYRLRVYGDTYVDKSMLIREFVTSFVITPVIKRPPGWGKSVNMDMLKRFLEIELDDQGNLLTVTRRINPILFGGGEIDLPESNGTKVLSALKISSDADTMKHFGQYPTISLNFDRIRGDTYEQIEREVHELITNLFRSYRYFLYDLKDEINRRRFENYLEGRANVQYLQESLHYLSELASKRFGKKVCIFLDNFDTTMIRHYLNISDRLGYEKGVLERSEEFQSLLNLFGGMIHKGLRRNEHLHKGMVSGIGMTNLFSYSLMDENLCGFYGFTRHEIDRLQTSRGNDKMADEEVLERWYNGYKFGDNRTLYRPSSVIDYLSRNGSTKDDYQQRRTSSVIDSVMSDDSFQPTVQRIIAGNHVNAYVAEIRCFDQIEKRDRQLSILLFFGYLTPVRRNGELSELRVPNEEVRQFYEAKFEQWLDNELSKSNATVDTDNRCKSNVDKHCESNVTVDTDNHRKSNVTNKHLTRLLLAGGRKGEFTELLNRTLSNRLNRTHTQGPRAERLYNVVLKCYLKSPDCRLWNAKLNSTNADGSCKLGPLIVEPTNHKYDTAAVIAINTADKVDSAAGKLVDGSREVASEMYDVMLRGNRNVRKILRVSVVFYDGVHFKIHYRMTE